MNDVGALRELILAAGLEDLIALPEIALTADRAGLLRRDRDGWTVLMSAMADAIARGEVQVWSGRWPTEPRFVSWRTALELVAVAGKYEFNSVEDRCERVYFVNVENLRVPDPGGPLPGR